MNPIFGFNRGLDYSYLFQSGTFRTNSIDAGISFHELNMIKTGAYRKLTNSYYDKKKVISGIHPSEIPKAKMKNLSNVKSFSKAIENTATELMNADFSDRKSALKSVKAFVTSYNNLIESSEDTENTSILRREVQLTGSTNALEPLLSEIGITIEKGNLLKVDEEKFEKVEISKVEDVLKGKKSYDFLPKVMRATTVISDIASNQLNSWNKTYNRDGKYYSYDYATKIYEAV